jgi:flagellin
MEQLSTGSKINSASDDAAGLAMAAKFTAQIKGLDMAVKNANDAVSMISTAEGALDEVATMLQRMRELAVQSSNGTVTAEDRDYMDLEYQALNSEITRIANNTQWNGENILDGTAGAGSGTSTSTVTFQVSANYSSTPGSFATTTGEAVVHNSIIGQTQAAVTAAGTFTGTGTPTGAGATVYQVGDTFDGITLAAGGSSLSSATTSGEAVTHDNIIGQTQAQVAAGGVNTGTGTASGTGAAVYQVGDTFDGITLAAGTTEARGASTTNDVITVDFGNLSTALGSTGSANVTGSDVDTQSNATSAIGTLDAGIVAINTQRATFGAASNRLEHAVDNMTNIQNNAEASRSRIEDTDYAETTSELAKAQIIAQAGTAMLAQANQSPQSVLSLLR